MDLPITKKVHAEKRPMSKVCDSCMKPIGSCGCSKRGDKK